MKIKETIKEKLGKKIISWEEKSSRRIYFSVDKSDVYETVRLLFKDLGLRFSTASGMQTPAGFEILYHFSFDQAGELYSLRVEINDKERPEIDAITPLFPAAEWVEREIWEMLGINFKGHPNLKRLLLADDWPDDKYPLRRSS
ncbi:MAG: NADH-quinone oxidoreductase subunit C [Candidatus Omnitrophota bacterium]